MKNKASVIRSVICAVMLICLLSFLVISFIPGVCSDHDCSGERCFICLCVSAQKNLSEVLILAALATVAFAPIELWRNYISERTDIFIEERTPVCLKVKLSN